jgi:O-antigen ligase
VLSVSGNGRTAYWRVARGMVARDPLLGAGAGSYERWWLQERPTANAARNAHDLYLETLAELGPLGLALLLGALGIPLWAARRARGILASTALAAYVAWLVHALLDWDWQIPAVTLPALACGAAVLVLARPGTERRLTPRLRAALLVPLATLLLAALGMHAGNRAADAAASAVARGDDAAALADAHRARRWMPWAVQPLQLAGEAELAGHRDAAARADLRRALARDSEDWSTWYDLASVTTGSAHRQALRRARALDPLEPELASAR